MTVRILTGDCRDVLRTLPDESVHCVVTSPPYWGLRDYGVEGQMGLEPTYQEFVASMVDVFADVGRVLREDGTLWLNLGDSYASQSGAGWQGKNGQRADRRFTAVRDTVGLRQFGRSAPSGLKPKDLVGVPWRVAFALQDAGWWLRQDIIWSKPNPMPESVTDRCTKAHEYLFLLTKSEHYHFDQGAILEPCSPNTHARLSQDVQAQIGSTRVPGKTNGNMKAVGRGQQGYSAARGNDRDNPGGGSKRKLAESGSGIKNNDSMDAALAIMPAERNKRSVWTVTTQPFSEAHFATFPPALIEPCILAGCPKGGTVLDPFFGAGTTGLVADRLGRDCIGIELNPEYVAMAKKRIEGDAPLFTEVA